MKLNKEVLKGLIKEVRGEQNRNSMILTEAMAPSDNYAKLVAILEGRAPNVKTVGIMSGQNPMAQETSHENNAMLANKLKSTLTEMGLEHEEVGGVFGGHPEESVIILNPTLKIMEQLNRMFTQWGFVWGENLPTFTMYQVDYKSEAGIVQARGSEITSEILKDDEVSHVKDNYTFDNQTGKKFVIPLYGGPE